MKASTKVIHDDWKTAITVRKLAANQGSQTDELGWVPSAVPVYQFSYTVNALVHVPAVTNKRDQARADAVYTVSGKEYRVAARVRIFTDELGANPTPDTDCEAVVGGRAYRILACDLAANQYILVLSSEK